MPLISIAYVEALAEQALIACGTRAAAARSVARSIAAAEADGQRNVGLGFLPTYCEHVRCGKVDGRAEPVVTSSAPAVVGADAAHGFAHPALEAGEVPLLAAARAHGIALLAVTRSYACGAVGYHVEQLAGHGMVALAFANAPRSIAPWGGRKPLFGTNPLAFAFPRGGGREPLVIDMSSSAVAKVAVIDKAARGEPIPIGWALDAQGRPTTDADEGLKGSMAPAGGHKGAALALMVELLAAGLTGANWSKDASMLGNNEGGPPGLGQLVIAIDAGRLAPGFSERAEDLLAAALAEPGVRLPGDQRLAARRKARAQGIDVPDELIARIRSYC